MNIETQGILGSVVAAVEGMLESNSDASAVVSLSDFPGRAKLTALLAGSDGPSIRGELARKLRRLAERHRFGDIHIWLDDGRECFTREALLSLS